MSRATQRTDAVSYVAEGLYAYAAEQSNAEEQRAIRWTTQWAAVRDRARFVLDTQLSNVETQVPLPELVVELEDEDERDDEDEADLDEDEAY
jgi:hypothetical protein